MNEQCPRCGSYNTKKDGRIQNFFMMIAVAGVTAVAGILFFPIWILTALAFIAAPVMLFVKPKWECKECKNKWEVTKPSKEKRRA